LSSKEQVTYFPKEKHPMRKPFAFAVMLAAALGLAACDKASEDKAQDAAQHTENAQQKMDEAQDKVNEAAKENAEAAKDSAEAQQKAAEEAAKEAAPAAPAEPAK
jgi:gas vesicle protein